MSLREKKVQLLELSNDRKNIVNQINDLEYYFKHFEIPDARRTTGQSELVQLRIKVKSLDFEIDRLKGELKDLYK